MDTECQINGIKEQTSFLNILEKCNKIRNSK